MVKDIFGWYFFFVELYILFLIYHVILNNVNVKKLDCKRKCYNIFVTRKERRMIVRGSAIIYSSHAHSSFRSHGCNGNFGYAKCRLNHKIIMSIRIGVQFAIHIANAFLVMLTGIKEWDKHLVPLEDLCPVNYFATGLIWFWYHPIHLKTLESPSRSL